MIRYFRGIPIGICVYRFFPSLYSPRVSGIFLYGYRKSCKEIENIDCLLCVYCNRVGCSFVFIYL